MEKKVLVLGATGAMGKYLVPYLAEGGYTVDAVSLDESHTPFPNVRDIRGNAKDKTFLEELLANRYDGVVDFMIYRTADLAYHLPLMLANTGHYIYLSSYRVYDNKEHPVRETSPRLLDTGNNIILRNSDDYSIYKARGENIVRTFPKEKWTIVRPAITYSLMRYQLVTLEAPDTVVRAFAGKKVVLPEQAREVQATMSWAGDVARMIADSSSTTGPAARPSASAPRNTAPGAKSPTITRISAASTRYGSTRRTTSASSTPIFWRVTSAGSSNTTGFSTGSWITRRCSQLPA